MKSFIQINLSLLAYVSMLVAICSGDISEKAQKPTSGKIVVDESIVVNLPTVVEALKVKEFFVSATGLASGDGSITNPFNSLVKARDAIRSFKAKGSHPAGAIVVQVRGGEYTLKHSFELEAQDSGTEKSPIIYTAYNGESVSLNGGLSFDLTQFSSVSDPEMRQRIPRDAREHVLEIDLRDRGLGDIGDSPLLGQAMQFLIEKTKYRTGARGPELFLNGEPMTLARWPNEGFSKTGMVVESGDVIRAWMDDAKGGRVMNHEYVPEKGRSDPPKGFSFKMDPERLARWKTADAMMLKGYWFYNWSDQTVKVASIDAEEGIIRSVQPSAYSIKQGQRFFAYNLIEELDAPGEWYIDRASGVLYLYPPHNDDAAMLELSVITESLIKFDGASHLTIKGFDLKLARAALISINDGENVTIDSCRIGNGSSNGVTISGGKSHVVQNSEIYTVGASGISATGGDRAALRPANHLILNNEIHNFSRLERAYKPGIHFRGVGLTALHNEIHNAPHSAIIFYGNNHTFKYNHIYNVCYESDDAAAVYSGRSWTFRGNVIQYNLFRDIEGYKNGTHRVSGIYMDDGVSGTIIDSNIFLNVAQGVFMNGGRDTFVTNNVFINNANMMRGTDMTKAYTTWATMSWKTLNEDLNSMPIESAQWAQQYPELVDILSDEPQLPKNNTVTGNLLYQTPMMLGDSVSNFASGATVDANQKGIDPKFIELGEVGNNMEFSESPGRYNPVTRRFEFNEAGEVFEVFPQGSAIPTSKIGRLD